MGENNFGIKLLQSSVSFFSEFVQENVDFMLDRRTGFRAEQIEIKKTNNLPLLPYSTIKYLEEKPVKNFTQDFIFKGLSARIESSLKEKLLPVLEAEKSKLCGIKLLSSSADKFTAFEEVNEHIERKGKRRKVKRKDREYSKEAIEESAVGVDWIISGQACQGWKDTKRPRVTRLRLVHAASDGSLTCDHLAT